MKLQRSEDISVTRFTQNHTFRESLETEGALQTMLSKRLGVLMRKQGLSDLLKMSQLVEEYSQNSHFLLHFCTQVQPKNKYTLNAYNGQRHMVACQSKAQPQESYSLKCI